MLHKVQSRSSLLAPRREGHLTPVGTTLWGGAQDVDCTRRIAHHLWRYRWRWAGRCVRFEWERKWSATFFRTNAAGLGQFVGPVKVFSKRRLDIEELRNDPTLRLVDIDSDGDADLCHTHDGTLRCFINTTCSRKAGNQCHLSSDPFPSEINRASLDKVRTTRPHPCNAIRGSQR